MTLIFLNSLSTSKFKFVYLILQNTVNKIVSIFLLADGNLYQKLIAAPTTSLCAFLKKKSSIFPIIQSHYFFPKD